MLWPGSDHRQDKDRPQVEQVGGFHLFPILMFMFWNDLLVMIFYLNPCCKRKRRRRVGLNSWWLLKQLWNVERVLDECWNNDENVRVLKWPIWGEHLIELWWILNRIWDVVGAIMNLGCQWMVIWAVRRIYFCILIECNGDKWLYEYYEGSTILLY